MARRTAWTGGLVAAVVLPLALGGLPACQGSGDEDDWGIEGPFQEDVPLGKADSAGVPGPWVNNDTRDTQVWTARNRWEDRDTAEARAAGIAWPADSGLNWDEKYALWVESMEHTPAADSYYDTFVLTTPWGKQLPAPKLECAEVAMFLRVTFASWYGLPFYMTTIDAKGIRVYFGHFGARTKTSRYQNTPRFGVLYRDYTKDFAGKSPEAVVADWPKDESLRSKSLYGGGDDMDFVFPGAKAGAYFDEIFLNKRVGYFLRVLLPTFGSMNLVDSRNTYNLKPQAVRAGDVLLERWQRQGIGHTLPVKQVTALPEGRIEAQLVSGSMPRRQPKWHDAVDSKRYFTSEEMGGDGTSWDGDPYYELGGGLKRWRVTKNIGGYWTNTWMSADEASWISDTDYDRLKTRPAEFEDLLGEVDPVQQRDALLRIVEDARNHLREYPASCSARINREKAFGELSDLNDRAFGVSAAETDQQYRILDDYVFAELVYEQAKTCCWDSSTAAMYTIIMDYNRELLAASCQEPVVFKALGGGYDLFATYAEETGRGAQWKSWSEDESCPQRDQDNDVETAHDWIPWCEVSASGTP